MSEYDSLSESQLATLPPDQDHGAGAQQDVGLKVDVDATGGSDGLITQMSTSTSFSDSDWSTVNNDCFKSPMTNSVTPPTESDNHSRDTTNDDDDDDDDAATAAAGHSFDVSVCSQCSNLFNDPRMLPCSHTFCLQCIKDRCGGDQHDERSSFCPTCKKVFHLTDAAIDEIPKNRFITRLVYMKKFRSTLNGPRRCDVCQLRREGQIPQSADSTARHFCFSCEFFVCDECQFYHETFKKRCTNTTIKLGESLLEEAELYRKFPPFGCEKHDDGNLEIYCNQCGDVCCMRCYLDLHNSHKSCHINDVMSEFRSTVDKAMDEVNQFMEKCTGLKRKLDDQRAHVEQQIQESKGGVCEKAQKLHELIDRHKDLLLDNLDKMLDDNNKWFEAAFKMVLERMRAIERLKTYTEEVINSGTASDLIQEFRTLKPVFGEFSSFDKFKRSIDEIMTVCEISFVPSDVITESSPNVVGIATMTTLKPETADQTVETADKGIEESTVGAEEPVAGVQEVIASGFPVSNLTNNLADISIQSLTLKDSFSYEKGQVGIGAIAVHGDRLFLGRNGVVGIDVRSISTLSYERTLNINGLGKCVYGLAASDINNCLFISDHQNRRIVSVDLSTFDIRAHWNVKARPRTLVINAVHNILIACNNGKIGFIKEYTPGGDLVHEVNISDAIPTSIAELADGQLMVSYYSSQSHGIYVVGLDGSISHNYGGLKGTGNGQFNCPFSLVYLKQRNSVIVADYANHRLVSLNSTLSVSQPLPLLEDGVMQFPLALWWDESRGFLIVGQDGEKHLLICSVVCNKSQSI